MCQKVPKMSFSLENGVVVTRINKVFDSPTQRIANSVIFNNAMGCGLDLTARWSVLGL